MQGLLFGRTLTRNSGSYWRGGVMSRSGLAGRGGAAGAGGGAVAAVAGGAGGFNEVGSGRPCG